MTRSALLVAILALPLAGVPASAGNVKLFFGGKTLNSGDWSPVQRQGEGGVEIDLFEHWPVALAIDFMRSRGDKLMDVPAKGLTDVNGNTSELDLGVRKPFRPGQKSRPFIEGGLALVRAEYSTRDSLGKVSDSSGSTGLWLGGGVYWTLGTAFDLGFELRLSAARASLFGKTVDAGGRHFGMVLGYHWGA